MMLYAKRVRRAGFTLIEIMIVIAIIAILAGIVVPNVVMARFEAGLTACHENCKAGVQALRMATIRHTLRDISRDYGGGFFQFGEGWSGCVNESLVESGYLSKPLCCRATNSEYYFEWDIGGSELGEWEWYRDWQCTQKIVATWWFCVYCGNGHQTSGGRLVYPLYDDSAGACFYY